MDSFMKEYVESAYNKARIIMSVIDDIGMSLLRRCRGALESDGKHQIVCQLSPLTNLLDKREKRYKNDDNVMDGIYMWRAIIDSALSGSVCPVPYIGMKRYKTKKGSIVRIKNAQLTAADDLHIVVSFDVETEEKEA